MASSAEPEREYRPNLLISTCLTHHPATTHSAANYILRFLQAQRLSSAVYFPAVLPARRSLYLLSSRSPQHQRLCKTTRVRLHDFFVFVQIRMRLIPEVCSCACASQLTRVADELRKGRYRSVLLPGCHAVHLCRPCRSQATVCCISQAHPLYSECLKQLVKTQQRAMQSERPV